MSRQIVTEAELKERFEELLAFVTDAGDANDVVVAREGVEVCVIVPLSRYVALGLALRTYQRHAEAGRAVG